MNRKIIISLLIAFIVVVYGCKQDSILGLNFLPQDDALNLNLTDTVTIKAFTVLDDSLETGFPNTFLLGVYNDPIFGRAKAQFATQILINKSADYLPVSLNGIADSMVIYLGVDSVYNEIKYGTGTEIKINVYRLTDRLDNAQAYYSNEPDYNYHGDEIIGTATLSNSEDEVLAIKLNQSVAQDFIDNSANYFSVNDTLYFQEVFYGFFFEVVDDGSTDGFIARFNPDSDTTKVTLYYSTADKLVNEPYSFLITSDAVSFNLFSHSFSDEINNTVLNPTLEDSVAYLQSMGGTKVKLQFPYLSNFKNIGNIVINKAELVVKVENSVLTYEDSYPALEEMAIVGYNTENELVLIDEFMYGSTYTGSDYSDNEYRFTITRQVENYINSEYEDIDLYLIALQRRYNFGRTVITTGNHSKSIKLLITFTAY